VNRAQLSGALRLGALALAVGCVTALWWVFGDPNSTRRHGAAAGTQRQPPTTTVRLSARPPSVRSFDLELATEGSSEAGKLFSTSLKGVFHVQALSEDPSGSLYRGRIANPELSQLGADAQSAALLEPLEQQLGWPFEFAMASDGAASNIRLQSSTDAFVARLIRSVIAYSQVVTSPEPETEWEAVESEPSGTALFRYRTVSSTELHKQKLRLLERSDAAAAAGLNAQEVELIGGSAIIWIDAKRLVTRLEYQEQLSAALPSLLDDAKLKVDTRFRLSNGRAGDAAAQAGMTSPFGSLSAARPLQHEPAAQGRSYWADLQRIGGRDLKAIVGELAMAGKQNDTAARSRLYVATTALLRRDPAAVAQAVEAIHADSSESDFLVSALGHAGSADATSALTELLGQAGDAATAATVLRALGNAREAGSTTVNAMAARFGDENVGGLARLMVGALANGHRESAPATSEEAVAQLLAALDRDKDTLHLADTLRALGNTGHPAAVAAAERFVNSVVPMLRAAAAQAVRLVPGAEAESVLSRLLTDQEVTVRTSALNACLDRNGSSLLASQVESLGKLDGVPAVRREAIRVLVTWQTSIPSARTALFWISVNDENEKLRAVAAEGLNRFNQRG
jgi:lipoprotein